jgi:hypothetical protein
MALATLVALLPLLSAAPASAASLRPASCLVGSHGASAPKTLDELRECQAGAREDLIDAAESKGKPLTAAQLDKIDDLQRAEARKFLARPQIVSTGPAAPDEGAAATKGNLGGVTPADAARVDPKSASGIKGLQDRLQAAAGDGKNGITPAMADDIRATLTQSQGSISPDMKALLDGVQKDGGKLTPDTMKLLQGAGRAAKGSGLDLNIDPSMEKELLNHDFEADKPAFNSQQPPASN